MFGTCIAVFDGYARSASESIRLVQNVSKNSEISVVVKKAKGTKCIRCWKIVKETKDNKCSRCSKIK